MKVASFIISLIAISVTVWNFIWEHFYIKEKILLTVSDALIESNNLKVLLLYTNTGNQINTITNTSIQLDTDERIHIECHNHILRCQWIQPFTLSGKEQKCLTIQYPLPDFNETNVCNISIRILTSYINRKGDLYTDHFTVGNLFQTYNAKLAVTVIHKSHKLSGNKCEQTWQ